MIASGSQAMSIRNRTARCRGLLFPTRALSGVPVMRRAGWLLRRRSRGDGGDDVCPVTRSVRGLPGVRVAPVIGMRRVLWIVLCFSACTAAEPNGTPDGGTGNPCDEAKTHSDLAWIQTNIFTPSCAFGTCHKAPAVAAGHLILDAGQSHGQLVNTASTSASSWMRVVPGDSAKSYLLVAIGAQSGPRPVDGIMPLSNPPLCSDKVDAIRRWIAAGAPP